MVLEYFHHLRKLLYPLVTSMQSPQTLQDEQELTCFHLPLQVCPSWTQVFGLTRCMWPFAPDFFHLAHRLQGSSLPWCILMTHPFSLLNDFVLWICHIFFHLCLFAKTLNLSCQISCSLRWQFFSVVIQIFSQSYISIFWFLKFILFLFCIIHLNFIWQFCELGRVS